MQKSISLAFETILLYDGKAQNLKYHQDRLSRTRCELFGFDNFLSLQALDLKTDYKIARCKVTYGKTVEKIEIQEYHKKPISKFAIISSDIDYTYKLTDRGGIDEMFARKGDADDVLIVRDNLLTDTSIANIALFDGTNWLTPKEPLLAGTMRAKLLDDGFLIEADIRSDDLPNYQKIAIMNALRGFEIVTKPILVKSHL